MNKYCFPKQIPVLMGILNVTEDSFSDGAQFLDRELAVKHTEKMIAEGAEIIDMGAESTRPGSLPVPADIQIQRIIPILSYLKEKYPEVTFSVDTQKATVAEKAIEFGASIINDISALRTDPALADLLSAHPKVKVILMHMQGTPYTMQLNPVYQDVLKEINDFFQERIDFCLTKGILKENIMLDPGIGFGKNLEHNLTILANLKTFKEFGLPLVVGASRKSFIDKISPSSPSQRLGGCLAAALVSACEGINILRVHDVLLHKQFFEVLTVIAKAKRD
ncbi:MAG TPA: dihydropteroate synthase [Candidatus Cloacimonas sp.]|nr:dihydropteroate synthase [Candidatus Cloacimonas sp.]HNS84382.1 dihydropteroate synthase [Candidatus Cloacimonas sp.]